MYAFFTAQKDHQTIEDVAIRAKAYNIPSEVCDGMDVIEVYKAIHRAVERARKGEGPSLVECKTYRYSGQTDIPPDPQLYRTKEEVNEWKKKDCIERLKKEMIKAEIRPKEDMNIRITIGFLTYLLMTYLSTTLVMAHKNCANKVKNIHNIIINLN